MSMIHVPMPATYLSVCAMSPPYGDLTPLEWAVDVQGEILVHTLPSGALSPEPMQELARLRRARPWSHLVVVVPACLEPGVERLILQVTGACASVPGPRPSRVKLVRALSSEPCDESLYQWIVERRSDLKPSLRRSIRRCLGLSSPPAVAGLRGPFPPAKGGGTLEVRRKRHRRARVPSPAQIWRFHQALPVLLRLQRDSDLSILSAAMTGGFADASSFSRSCVRLFGESPGALRPMVGWRWLMWRWWHRSIPGVSESDAHVPVRPSPGRHPGRTVGG